MTVFEAARAVGVIEAAQKLGLPLRRTGTRYVTRCLYHPDKTPSMTLYPDGRFYCFSCRNSGDAITLYQQARGLTALMAARALCADFGLRCDGIPAAPPRVKPSAERLRKTLEDWRESRVRPQIEKRRDAAARMSLREEALRHLPPDQIWDDAEWAAAYDALTRAQEEIYRLDSLSPAGIMEEMRADSCRECAGAS